MITNEPTHLYNDLTLQRNRAIRRLYGLLFSSAAAPTPNALEDAKDKLVLLALERYYQWKRISDLRERYLRFTFDISCLLEYHYFASPAFYLCVPDRLYHWLKRNALVKLKFIDDQMLMIFDLYRYPIRSNSLVDSSNETNSRLS